MGKILILEDETSIRRKCRRLRNVVLSIFGGSDVLRHAE